MRQRTIFTNGDWALGYRDKNQNDCVSTVFYFANGNVERGERCRGKWHGQWESYTDGRREIGEYFNNIRVGDWKVIEKDGTETIKKY